MSWHRTCPARVHDLSCPGRLCARAWPTGDSRLLGAILCLCLSAAALADEGGQQIATADLHRLSLEDLMRLTVVTASRMEEQLPRSTSVISVITARDIERAGFRTISDVLARVPGFFPSTQATWKLIGSRGLIADGNDHILLLIDGHPQNGIVAHGFQQQDQIPALEKVARIEIIPRPRLGALGHERRACDHQHRHEGRTR